MGAKARSGSKGTLDRKAPQYWLWVTGPEYYLNEDGRDSELLDPALHEDLDGWWTCKKDTRRGDLALLWRKAPR